MCIGLLLESSINDTHREKLCFTQFSIRNIWLAASELFRMFTQSVKFYTFHYNVLRIQMFEKYNSSIQQSVEILNVFNTITLKQNFWKTKTFFKKRLPFFS